MEPEATARLEKAHCRRVAALSVEMARQLELAPVEVAVLEQAAMVHHHPRELLVEDVSAPGWHIHGERFASDVARQAGDLFHQPAGASPLMNILELANGFDERLEYAPFASDPDYDILADMPALVEAGVYSFESVSALDSLRTVKERALAALFQKAPVYPAVLLEAIALSSDPEVPFSKLEEVFSRDQVLAGLLIRAANSGLNGRRERVSAIRQALVLVGLETSRKLIAAAAVKPLVASKGLEKLWRHSLEISELAESLAGISSRANPMEAFLAGLVHDVGRVVMSMVGGKPAETYARLIERGCEPVFAEYVLCGTDHGTIGARLLRYWKFPEQLVEAVASHHQPEHSTSELAALLYLAEYLSGSEEDLSSVARLRAALERVGMSFETLKSRGTPGVGSFGRLIEVA